MTTAPGNLIHPPSPRRRRLDFFIESPFSTVNCPWCTIDDERAARQTQQVWARPGNSGARPVDLRNSSTGPHRVRQPNSTARQRNKTYSGLDMNPKIVVAGLITVVVIVLILTAFIMWAVLSGASSFGS